MFHKLMTHSGRGIFLLALAYFATGEIARLLAIPPGYATPVWPAAGVALVAVLVYGNRLWPGIALGSMFVNVSTSLALTNDKHLALALTALIGGGATLQAVASAAAIRKYLGYPNALGSSRATFRFLLLAGPLGCIISPSVGVTALAIAGLTSWENFGFSWLVWWVGDTIGALIVTPLILTLIGEPEPQWRYRRQRVALPLLTTIVLAISLFLFARQSETRWLQQNFNDRAGYLSKIVKRDLGAQERALILLAAEYDESWSDRSLAWRHATEQLFRTGPGLVAVAFASDGVRIESVDPQANPGELLGFDRWLNFLDRHGADFSQFNEIAVLTDDDTQAWLVVPVYASKTGLRRLRAASGAVAGLIDLERLIAAAQTELGDLGMAWQIKALTVMPENATSPDSAALPEPQSTRRGLHNLAAWRYAVTLNLAGSAWQFDIYPTADFLELARSKETWTVLVIGLLFTALLGVFLLVQTGQTFRIESLNASLRQEIAMRLETQASLQQLSEGLKASNKELEQFAYVASHDLQEPLRTVTSFAEILQARYRDKLDEKGGLFLERMTAATRRMQRMIADLLMYSRAHSQEYTLELVSTVDTLRALNQDLSTLIRDTGAEIAFDETLPVVHAHATSLRQLLENLIVNAIKFRSEKPPRIEIEARLLETHWHFVVRDNGIGIDPQHHEHIFNAFARLKSNDESGTGLGLAICRRIVERHGGRIWVESTPGQGSAFRFTLPAQRT